MSRIVEEKVKAVPDSHGDRMGRPSKDGDGDEDVEDASAPAEKQPKKRAKASRKDDGEDGDDESSGASERKARKKSKKKGARKSRGPKVRPRASRHRGASEVWRVAAATRAR